MASDTIAIKITNLSEIRAAFATAPFQMTTQLNIAIKKTLLNIQRSSMINSPVRTGRLRASHSSEFGNLKGQVGTHVNYDIFVHNGTRYQRAQPYLKDAVESTNEDTEKFFTDAVQNVLTNIASKT